MADKLQAALHGLCVAGGVHHHVEEFAVGCTTQLRFVICAQRDRTGHAQFAPAKIQPVLARVQRRDLRTAQPGKNHGRHADRPGTYHQHALTQLHLGAAHGMRAYGQKFDHRGLVQRHAFGLVHKLFGQREVFAKSAVAVHAEHLNGDAAIGLTLTAGNALAAGQIGHHIHRVSHGQTPALRCLGHLAGKLVAHDARVLQERLGAAKDV